MAQAPRTVEDAVNRLISELTPEMRSAMIVMSREQLVELHFGLGMAIRNGYGLHDPDSPLMDDAVEKLGLTYLRDPDIVSGKIIERAWHALQSQSGTGSAPDRLPRGR